MCRGQIERGSHFADRDKIRTAQRGVDEHTEGVVRVLRESHSRCVSIDRLSSPCDNKYFKYHFCQGALRQRMRVTSMVLLGAAALVSIAGLHAAATEKTLYERLGGQPAIKAVASELVDSILLDSRVNK